MESEYPLVGLTLTSRYGRIFSMPSVRRIRSSAAAGATAPDAADAAKRLDLARICRMSEDDSNRSKSRAFEPVVTPKLNGCVVSLCDHRLDRREFFSGTLIAVNGRVGVISCAHALPGNPRNRVWLIRREGSFRSRGIPDIVNVIRPAGEYPDVGFLEIGPVVLNNYLRGQVPIGPEDLGCLDYGALVENPVTVTGNLVEDVLYQKIGAGDVMRSSIVYMNHRIVPLDDWPAPKRDAVPANSAVDFYIYSVKAGEADVDREEWYYRSPNGLSGGGVWALPPRPGALVTPADFKLIGVQSAWNKEAGMLRATRIEALLELAPFLRG